GIVSQDGRPWALRSVFSLLQEMLFRYTHANLVVLRVFGDFHRHRLLHSTHVPRLIRNPAVYVYTTCCFFLACFKPSARREIIQKCLNSLCVFSGPSLSSSFSQCSRILPNGGDSSRGPVHSGRRKPKFLRIGSRSSGGDPCRAGTR